MGVDEMGVDEMGINCLELDVHVRFFRIDISFHQLPVSGEGLFPLRLLPISSTPILSTPISSTPTSSTVFIFKKLSKIHF